MLRAQERTDRGRLRGSWPGLARRDRLAPRLRYVDSQFPFFLPRPNNSRVILADSTSAMQVGAGLPGASTGTSCADGAFVVEEVNEHIFAERLWRGEESTTVVDAGQLFDEAA